MARVLLVGKGSPERGGIPSFLAMLLKSPELADHELQLLNLARDTSAKGGRFDSTNAWHTIQDAHALWRRARHFDVVHVHTALVPTPTVLRAAFLCLAARVRGRRVILHVHGGLALLWLNSRRRRMLLRAALSGAHVVITVSQGLEDLLGGLAHGRVLLVDNGVDTDAFSGGPSTSSPPLVLAVGLLTPRKGLIDLFEASAILKNEGIDHDLQVVGGTPTEGIDAEQLVRSHAPLWATLSGTSAPDEMPAIYRSATIFCLPSWYEAMPLSVLEAMATGLPVVATDVGDVSRVVQDGETGFLVPPRQPKSLASALGALLSSPERRCVMGRAARQWVTKNHSVGATTRRINDLYVDLGRTQ